MPSRSQHEKSQKFNQKFSLNKVHMMILFNKNLVFCVVKLWVGKSFLYLPEFLKFTNHWNISPTEYMILEKHHIA